MTPPTATKSCLDAETLAAWVDGGLDARAAALAEAHVSSCPRCQEIAGLIIKTTPTTVEARSWFSLRAAWLVPLTAGVAAVGLWMIVPTDRATAPPTPASIAAAPKVAQAPPADRALADQLKQKAPAAPAEEFRAKEQGARARDLGAKNEAASAKAPSRQGGELAKDADKKRFDEARADTAADANKLAAQTPPVFAPPPPSPAAPPRPQAAPAAVSPAPAGAAASESRRIEAQSPARQTFAQVVTREAASPDGSVRWRLTSTNTLERSTDQGRTWVSVETGAGGPLASVEATDNNIATVTTVDGRQFRTTDSGKTWRLQ